MRLWRRLHRTGRFRSDCGVYNLNCGDNTNSYGFNEIKYSTFSSGTTVCAYGVSFTAPSGYAPTAVYNTPDNLACGFYNTVYSSIRSSTQRFPLACSFAPMA